MLIFILGYNFPRGGLITRFSKLLADDGDVDGQTDGGSLSISTTVKLCSATKQPRVASEGATRDLEQKGWNCLL